MARQTVSDRTHAGNNEMQTDAISILNELIETCRDGQKGFHEAAEAVQSNHLRSMFMDFSAQRAQFVGQLQEAVRQLGGDPERSGSVAGALHRGWINLKAAITARDDGQIVAECERGEDVAKHTYEKAVSKSLPSEVRPLVETQYEQVKMAHDQVRGLEVGMKSK